jgi:hypothetical protein
VQVRVLPGPGDVTPPGESLDNGMFDLGATGFTVRLT